MALDPKVSITNAIQAYNQASHSGAVARALPDETAPPPTSPFAQLVKDGLGQAAATGRASEVQATAAIADGADLTQVVTAISEAELTLQTVVAVRDKVIDAYREIFRMPI